MFRKLVFFLTCYFFFLFSFPANAKGVDPDFPEVPYSIGEWPVETYGNYRAVVEVHERSDAVFLRLPWRRRDVNPEGKKLIIVDATTKKEIENVFSPKITREYGDIVFQPVTVPGTYYIYYMPYHINHSFFPNTIYLAPEDRADSLWKASLPMDVNSLNKAELVEFQAADPFYRVNPMEVIATVEETRRLIESSGKRDYLLFPEKSEFPIVMKYDIPLRWILKGPSGEFTAKAQPGEYFTFQIGFLALKDVDNIDVSFQCKQISGDAFTCFNTGGTDWKGEKFDKKLPVKANQVQALWCGVQIPENFRDKLNATVIVRPRTMAERRIQLTIDVSGENLPDGGVSDIYKMARLKWLNSTIGLDDKVFGDYTPVTIKNDEIGILGRKIILGRNGLPGQIISTFDDMSASFDAPARELLSAPIQFVAEKEGGSIRFDFGEHRLTEQASGAIIMVTSGTSPEMIMECRSKTECDGYINYAVTFTAKEDIELSDIRLEIPFRKDITEYMMGMGRKGGFRPESWSWEWNIESSNSVFWLGTVGAGLQCRLKGYEDIWEVFNFKDTGIPEDWHNEGRGGCLMEEQRDEFMVNAFSGKRSVKKGDKLLFRFGLLITPVKPLDNDHWQWRYWHRSEFLDQPDSIFASGANIINIHHANRLNPYINYPFIATDTLKPFVDEAHKHDTKVKLYYTVRELSVRAPELFALRSLGNEVFRTGEGFRLADRFTRPTETGGVTGESWLCEHLIYDYLPAWHHYFSEGHWDAAIAQSGLSRWNNYYLEGLNWLVNEVGIDGIYIDGLGYDREIMKRVRKVMDRSHPGCLIDFHCGNHFHPKYGMNNISNFFMEHFPYINSLWLGEGFNYDESPDYWLVELSGIPFGLYGEMLQGCGNPFRGMVFGMSTRFYGNCDPSEMWKLWDDFGIQESQMLGYWSKRCPVKTGDADVKATAYVKDGETLIAVGNWGDNKFITLNIDWDAIGIDKSKASIKAPVIKGIQKEKIYRPDESIMVKAGKGSLLIVYD
ncbi:MAG: glycoside hydrolase domain-containing protein [Bacteroidales bacterium]